MTLASTLALAVMEIFRLQYSEPMLAEAVVLPIEMGILIATLGVTRLSS